MITKGDIICYDHTQINVLVSMGNGHDLQGLKQEEDNWVKNMKFDLLRGWRVVLKEGVQA